MQAPVDLAHEPPFRIGPLEIRPSTHELGRDGQTVIIEPRVMQVLIALARANGAVVTRDELVEQCWQGRIVGDDAIHRVLSRLRRVSEGIARGVFQVETITKVGYRLKSHVSVVSSGPRVEIGQLEDARPSAARYNRRVVLAGAGAVTLAAGSLWLLNKSSDLVPHEARTLIHQGRESLKEGTADRITSGVSLLRKATEIAPQRAETWGALALAYQQQSMRSSSAARAQVEARGMSAANRALALDPDNADAFGGAGHNAPFFQALGSL